MELTDEQWARLDLLIPEPPAVRMVGADRGRLAVRCWTRYKHRWKIERMFAWLGNYRRLVVRYERHAAN